MEQLPPLQQVAKQSAHDGILPEMQALEENIQAKLDAVAVGNPAQTGSEDSTAERSVQSGDLARRGGHEESRFEADGVAGAVVPALGDQDDAKTSTHNQQTNDESANR